MKLKDGYTSSALKRCEVFQTENKKQSKTPLYFLFLIYIIWVYSLNYIKQTQKNRLFTLGETNIIFHWYFELCFTEIMIPESLFTVFQFQPQRFIFRQWHYSFYYLSINNYFVIRFTFTMWIVHKRMFIFMQRKKLSKKSIISYTTRKVWYWMQTVKFQESGFCKESFQCHWQDFSLFSLPLLSINNDFIPYSYNYMFLLFLK